MSQCCRRRGTCQRAGITDVRGTSFWRARRHYSDSMGYPATGDYVASALKARQAQAGSSRTVCVGIATCTRAWQVSRDYTNTWDADM